MSSVLVKVDGKPSQGIVPAAVVLVSLVYWFGVAYRPGSTEKQTLILVAAGVYLVSVVWAYGSSKTMRRVPRRVFPLLWSQGSYALVLALLFVIKPGGSKLVSVEVVTSLLAALFLYRHPLRRPWQGLAVNLVVLAFESWLLVTVVSTWFQTHTFVSVNRFFSSTNAMAEFAVVSSAFVLLSYSSLHFCPKVLVLLSGTNLFLSMLICILGYSRGAMVAFASMIAVLLIGGWRKDPRIASLVGALARTTMLGLLIVVATPGLRIEAQAYFSSIYKYHAPFFSGARLDTWRGVVSTAIMSPEGLLFGNPVLFEQISVGYLTHSHNTYLELLRSGGLPLLVLFLCCCIIALLTARRARPGLLPLAVLVLLLVQALFEDSLLWGMSTHFLIFWAMLAVSK